MITSRWLLAGLALAVVTDARTESAPGQAAVARGGSLAGTVIDDERQTPIASATVMASIDGAAVATTLSGPDGAFTLASLPPGRVTITARKDPYVHPAWRIGQPPSTYWVADGGRVADVMVRMRRGGVLEGVVTGSSGAPLAGARVTALRCGSFGASCDPSDIVSSRSAVTDSAGRYRLFGLPAGRYLISADAGRNRASEPVAYVPTYFGGVTDPSRAVAVDVELGVERAGLDIPVQAARTASVSGVVLGPDGQPAQVRELSVFPAGISISTSVMSALAMRADGSFATAPLPPGRYRFLARTAAPDQPARAAEALVELAGQDVTGVTMSLHAATLSGRVTFNGGAPVNAGPAVRIDLRRADAPVIVSSFDRASVVAGADGRFRIDGLLAGRYEVTCTVTSAGGQSWWPISAPTEGGDALDLGGVVAMAGTPELVLRLTNTAARISGLVAHHDGRPAGEFSVVAFPVEESLRGPRSRRLRLDPVAADGTFEMMGLPPGEYFVNAVGTSDPRELNTALLAQLATGAHRLSLDPAEQATVTLRLPRLGGGS